MSTDASAHLLHIALLRPAILHILRAAGFHACRPSVLDTLTDIAARYLLLLGSTTAQHALNNHNTDEPTVTDVRMALQDCALFTSGLTASEEAWREVMRRPLSTYKEGLARMKEAERRMREDTADVREFVDWVRGDANREIMRIAGLVGEGEGPTEDYLTMLKKKHSKTGEESRYQGTVLGKPADDKLVHIEGDQNAKSIHEWVNWIKERAESPPENGEVTEEGNEEQDPESMTITSETLDHDADANAEVERDVDADAMRN
ncbi:hypothetical protein M501DRAFT_1019059 [Patellaria atrata CBS 101060]|uniref:Bromodomain associated domain-containing protein n=1 Tax=Patellaria atrata CBS 101060 TaxID=1346257 RepID=A0A9P4S6M9_9PEZI|nr:hypothetical protein M501DRAFT_1019059 [Patellaria atrata CBS 101060]